jgi:hypothetical protein
VASLYSQAFRVVVFGASLLLYACSTAPRIDGRSDAAFHASHARLVASLSPEERQNLWLAEDAFALDRSCLDVDPIEGQPWIIRVLTGQIDFVSCHKELHGMTYRALVKARERR